MANGKKGFTLAELLIVVAIIAVLIGVLIPVFSGSMAKAKSAACAANRRSVQGEISVLCMTGGEQAVLEQFGEEGALPDSDRICPSGGTVSWKYTYNDHGVYNGVAVSCSVHTDSIESGDTPTEPGGLTFNGIDNKPVSTAALTFEEFKTGKDGAPGYGMHTLFTYDGEMYVTSNQKWIDPTREFTVQQLLDQNLAAKVDLSSITTVTPVNGSTTCFLGNGGIPYGGVCYNTAEDAYYVCAYLGTSPDWDHFGHDCWVRVDAN